MKFLSLFSVAIIFILTIILSSFQVLESKESLSDNLCLHNEKIFFSCRLDKNKQKILSVCGTKTLSESNKKGYLKYRFGTKNKIELEHPKGFDENSLTEFKYNSYTRAVQSEELLLVDAHYFSFSVANTVYIIYDETAAGYNQSERSAGIQAGDRDLKCQLSSVKDNLFELADIVPRDENLSH